MPCNGNWSPVNVFASVGAGVGVNVDADVVCQAVQQLATVDNRHGTADIRHRTLYVQPRHTHIAHSQRG